MSRNVVAGTFASLGLTEGTYVWRLGQSPDADTFTLNIGGGGVPEPSTWAMLILGAGMSGAAIRRRRARLA